MPKRYPRNFAVRSSIWSPRDGRLRKSHAIFRPAIRRSTAGYQRLAQTGSDRHGEVPGLSRLEQSELTSAKDVSVNPRTKSQSSGVARSRYTCGIRIHHCRCTSVPMARVSADDAERMSGLVFWVDDRSRRRLRVSACVRVDSWSTWPGDVRWCVDRSRCARGRCSASSFQRLCCRGRC